MFESALLAQSVEHLICYSNIACWISQQSTKPSVTFYWSTLSNGNLFVKPEASQKPSGRRSVRRVKILLYEHKETPIRSHRFKLALDEYRNIIVSVKKTTYETSELGRNQF